jgi:hypothetical protein
VPFECSVVVKVASDLNRITYSATVPEEASSPGSK